jgi:prepilin peptidase CpaA
MNYILLALLICCAATDVRSGRIPNLASMTFAAVGVALHSFAGGTAGFLFSAAGIATGLGLLIVPYLMGGMGAGDVKLMGAVGSFLGARATVEAFLVIAVFGGLYAVGLVFVRRDVFKGFFSEKAVLLVSMVALRQYIPLQTGNSGQRPRLKYGVAIAVGTITYLLLKSAGFTLLS